MYDLESIHKYFLHHTLTSHDDAKERFEAILSEALKLSRAIIIHCNDEPDKSVAIRKLREAIHCCYDAILYGTAGAALFVEPEEADTK